MGGAAPAIGSIVVGAIVGTAATKVASSLGLPDGLATMIGMGAGMAAGGAMTGAGGTAAGTSPVGAMTITGGAAQPSLSMADASMMSGVTEPTTIMGGGATPDLSMAGAGGPAAAPSMPSTSGGLLAQGTMPDLSMATAPMTPPKQPTTAQRQIEEATSQTPTSQEEGWWSKFFSPEKTMDLVMAGIKGYGEAGMRKWEIERPYEREDELTEQWERDDPGGGYLKSLRPPPGGTY